MTFLEPFSADGEARLASQGVLGGVGPDQPEGAGGLLNATDMGGLLNATDLRLLPRAAGVTTRGTGRG